MDTKICNDQVPYIKWDSISYNLHISYTFNYFYITYKNLVQCKYNIVAIYIYQFSSVQSLSHVQLFATPWTATRQASLSITNSRSLPKLMSIELVMPSSHLILCRPLLFLPSIPPSIRVFSNESTLCMR